MRKLIIGIVAVLTIMSCSTVPERYQTRAAGGEFTYCYILDCKSGDVWVCFGGRLTYSGNLADAKNRKIMATPKP